MSSHSFASSYYASFFSFSLSLSFFPSWPNIRAFSPSEINVQQSSAIDFRQAPLKSAGQSYGDARCRTPLLPLSFSFSFLFVFLADVVLGSRLFQALISWLSL